MIDLTDFSPSTAYVFDASGQRWWTESHLMIPIPESFKLEFLQPGQYLLDDGSDTGPDYHRVDWDPPPQSLAIVGDPVRANVTRDQQELFAGMVDADGRACVYLRVNGAFVNRIFVQIAEQITNTIVTEFGVRDSEHPVTMYCRGEVVGFIMPVRVLTVSNLIALGREVSRPA